MVLVGRKAPDFTAPAVLANGEIEQCFSLKPAISNKYGLVFFYPLDFTFVCPSELIALDNRIAAFKERGVEVIAVSIDSHYTHNAWRNTPIKDGGIGQVEFTLVADLNHRICQSYGVEHPESGIALRGAFIIDTRGIVRHQVVNDLPIGRNIDELLRTIDAILHYEEHGEVCPAGWQKDRKAMQANPTSVASYLEENAAVL